MKPKINLVEIGSIFLLILLPFSCTHNINEEQHSSKLYDTLTVDDNVKNEVVNEENIEKNGDFDYAYFYEDTIFNDILRVKYIDENKIKFKLIIENKNLKCKKEIVGTASLRDSETGIELDEDEEGNAYPVNEFEYKDKGCFTYIRISFDKKDKASIVFSKECGEVCNHVNYTVLKVRKLKN
jgi:hypothetical protein